jgi:OFA family oxalate/formate antiporter-like MFS transporter
MTQKTKRRRIFLVVLGAFGVAITGVIYAWTNYSELIRLEMGWDLKSLSLTFSIWGFGTGVAGILSGFLVRRFGARPVMMCGAILSALGFFLASQVGKDGLVMLYLSYGILVGFGSGLTFVPLFSTVLSWFPEKPGLISGMLMMGLGFGTLLLGAASCYLASAIGWRECFVCVAVLFFVVLSVNAWQMKLPGRDVVLPPPIQVEKGAELQDFKPREMLRTSAFWLFFVWAIIGNMSNVIASASAKQIADEVGASGFLAVNGVGLLHITCAASSVGSGRMFDRLGRKKTLLMLNAVAMAGGVCYIASIKLSIVSLMTLGIICIGISSGGVPACSSAFIRVYYGDANYPANYAIIGLRGIIASTGSYISAGFYEASGSYISVMCFMLATVVIGWICSLFIRIPKKTEPEVRAGRHNIIVL